MAAVTELVATVREAEDRGERRRAASDLVEAATATPEQVRPAFPAVVAALDDPDDAVRTALARVVFEVGTYDPTAVRPVLRDLVDALDDPVAGVRMNCTRPVAEAAAADPDAVRFAAPVLRNRLDDPSDSVRHSAAWALEWIATSHPGALPPDRAARCLDDDHPPVRKHGCRACALLRAAGAGGEPRHDRLVDLLNDDDIEVRAAAAHALGADGSGPAREALARAARTDLNGTVRTAARRALRAATCEATAAGGQPPAEPADAVLSDCLAAGDRAFGRWFRVDAPGVTPRAGCFRGAVIVVDPVGDEPPPVAEASDGTRSDRGQPDTAEGDAPDGTDRMPDGGGAAGDGSDTAGESPGGTEWPYVELRNAPVGYRVRLTRRDGTWHGTYAGHERTGSVSFEPAAVHRLDPDRTPLRHAVEGDRLSFTVEGAPHTVQVIEHDTDTGRVTGRNHERGHTVEFRPGTEGPLRALFEHGRAFEATDVRIVTEDEAA